MDPGHLLESGPEPLVSLARFRVSGLGSGWGSPCCRSWSESLLEVPETEWLVHWQKHPASHVDQCGLECSPLCICQNVHPQDCSYHRGHLFLLHTKLPLWALLLCGVPPKLGWWSRLGAPCTTVPFGQQIQAIVLLPSFHDEGDISFPSWHWYLLSMGFQTQTMKSYNYNYNLWETTPVCTLNEGLAPNSPTRFRKSVLKAIVSYSQKGKACYLGLVQSHTFP